MRGLRDYRLERSYLVGINGYIDAQKKSCQKKERSSFRDLTYY